MPTLNDLNNVRLRGRLVGAYDPEYWVEGLTNPVPQSELLTYILDNLGGGGTGENDVTEAAGDPSGAPGVGEPAIYQNTTTGAIFVWDGSQWNEVGGGEDDITEGAGVPSGTPGAGEPQVYQNTVNGNLYVWNGTAWVLVGGGENDITEGAGTPSGAPGAGEPQVYQDTTNGNVYTWDGSQWNIMAVVASNGLTKTGADIELGGTLEKNTDVEVSTFTLRFGRLVGTLLAYLRIVPGTGTVNLFTRNTTTSVEASFDLQPGSAIIEVDNDTQVSQISASPTAITAVVSENTVIQNRLLISNGKTEILNNRLEFKMDSAQNGESGYVLTLVDVVSGRAEFQPLPDFDGIDDITEGSSNPSAAPVSGAPRVYQNTTNGSLWIWNQPAGAWIEVCLKEPLNTYDSIADAQAAGLVKGDQFKLSQNNTEGGVAGTVIELL